MRRMVGSYGARVAAGSSGSDRSGRLQPGDLGRVEPEVVPQDGVGVLAPRGQGRAHGAL